MKQLYFIRHGQSVFNKALVWAGSSDTPLTEEGRSQAKRAGQKAAKQKLHFDIIISSPLERAHDTAKIVATELGIPHTDIVVDDRLVERNFGMLEGRKDLVAATKYALRESAIDSYKDVEPVADLQARADAYLDYLNTRPEDIVLVVGHGAFARALRRSVNKEPITHRGHMFANAEIVRFI